MEDKLKGKDAATARRTLLVATNNPGKVRDLMELLNGLPIRLVTPAELGLRLEVPETGASYAENARLKARAFAARSGMTSLADDSGLEIAILENWPGVESARCAGPGATDAARRALVLSRLAGSAVAERGARFVCHVVVANPTAVLAEAQGTVEGRIALSPSGSGGFGFDAIFVPDGSEHTFAEISWREKNEISHRARAIAALRPFFERFARTS
ncbi:MAG TPA: RdgB/HAM1 family non-canonical purine NTP pyrophosphatase [Chloroflexota bacterium]|nr:RdgB/HAM1 family non-canonical purine NTP pyrophosphatase [Chloroflexota bacterium]